MDCIILASVFAQIVCIFDLLIHHETRLLERTLALATLVSAMLELYSTTQGF
jgi:hypothetical protein